MNNTKIADGIFMLRENVKDILFEGIWKMPKGVSINSYIVKGEKTALIDGICGWDGFPETLYEELKKMEISLEDIKVLVINHMEPDHSGWLESFTKMHQGFDIYCSKESAALIRAFFHYDHRIHEIEDGETLELGNGYELQFTKIPNVHWPDTIETFEKKTSTLFSCDAFGGFGELAWGVTDDQIKGCKECDYEEEALRYYATVLGGFSALVGRAIAKTENINPKIIAPGHGMVFRENPQEIIDDYKRYVAYAKGPAKRKVTVLKGTMYGMSLKLEEEVVAFLKEKGYEVAVLDVVEADSATMFKDTWESTGILVMVPTYEYKMFPPAAAILDKLGKKKLTGKVCLYTGSYGWSGGAFRELSDIVERNRMKWNIVGDYCYNGSPTSEDKEKVFEGLKLFVEQMDELLA